MEDRWYPGGDKEWGFHPTGVWHNRSRNRRLCLPSGGCSLTITANLQNTQLLVITWVATENLLPNRTSGQVMPATDTYSFHLVLLLLKNRRECRDDSIGIGQYDQCQKWSGLSFWLIKSRSCDAQKRTWSCQLDCQFLIISEKLKLCWRWATS